MLTFAMSFIYAGASWQSSCLVFFWDEPALVLKLVAASAQGDHHGYIDGMRKVSSSSSSASLLIILVEVVLFLVACVEVVVVVFDGNDLRVFPAEILP